MAKIIGAILGVMLGFLVWYVTTIDDPVLFRRIIIGVGLLGLMGIGALGGSMWDDR